MTGRTYWRGLLAVAVMISVAGNTGHVLLTQADHRVAAAAWAAVPPLMLAAITHGLAATAGASTRRWVYRAGVAGAVAIAGMAFAVSFVALREVSILLGCPAPVAALMPLIVDAAIAVSTAMVLAVRPAAATLAAPLATPATAPATPAASVAYPGGNAWLTSGNSLAAAVATGEIDMPAEEIDVVEPDLSEAERIIGAAGIAATPEAVAVAVATLAAGRSQRAAAAASGLHRTQVGKIAALLGGGETEPAEAEEQDAATVAA